mmetsp:Transcript_23482/g.41289  ORF Transcript_23482/g.41289 Transcript_23482/m.41289 type:complete len:107 (+) Transcript_23482:304-624(+)
MPLLRLFLLTSKGCRKVCRLRSKEVPERRWLASSKCRNSSCEEVCMCAAARGGRGAGVLRVLVLALQEEGRSRMASSRCAKVGLEEESWVVRVDGEIVQHRGGSPV